MNTASKMFPLNRAIRREAEKLPRKIRAWVNLLPGRVAATVRNLMFWTNAEAKVIYSALMDWAKRSGKEYGYADLLLDEQKKLYQLQKALVSDKAFDKALCLAIQRQEMIISSLKLACKENSLAVPDIPAIPQKPERAKEPQKAIIAESESTCATCATVESTEKLSTVKAIKDFLQGFRNWEPTEIEGGEYYRANINSLEIAVKATEKSARFFLVEPGKSLKESAIKKEDLIAAIRAAGEGA